MKKYHENDDRYKKHCVDCGTKVVEWEYEWNGYDHPSPGKVIFSQDFSIDFGGKRCRACYNKLQDFVDEQFYKNKKKDDRTWEI